MRTRLVVSAAAALCGSLVACGGGGSGGPTAPATTVTSLTISPATDLMKLKATETFTATATMSNGTTTPVTATWRSSNPAVVMIDGTGRATAVTSGTTTITAEAQGTSSAGRALRVVPEYQGTWRGRVNARGCSSSGDFLSENFCGDLGTGDVDAITIALSQQNAAIATASVDIGGLAGAVTGSIAENGTLTLGGTYLITMDGFPFQIVVSDWQTTSTDNSSMTGRFVVTFRSPALSGEARVEAELLNTTKSSATLAIGSPGVRGRIAAALKKGRR